MKSYVKDMTVGNPTKLLLTFMLPLVLGNLFQQLYNMVDSIIVGQYVGADALAAVGATGSLNFLFFSLCSGMANGIGVVVAHHFGAGEGDNVKKDIANAVYIMLVTSIAMAFLGFTLSRPILTLLNTPENILDDSVLYMKIICMGVLAIALYNCIAAILRAVGDSKTPLYFLVVSSVLNIVLDLLFVRGFSMGVAGAGIATVISQFLSGMGSLIFAIAKNPYFKIEKSHMKADGRIIESCVRIGVPLSFQSSLIALSCVVLQSVVNTFGSVVVAAFTATSRIEQLVQQPYNSLCMSMSTFAGQNLGAGRIDRVKSAYKRGMLIMLIFSLIMLPIMQFGGHSIMRLFVDDSEVIAFGTQALRLTSWFYLLLGSIYVCRGILNGAGDAAFSTINGIAELVGRVCFAKPLTLIPVIGVWGVWLGTALTWALVGVISIVRYLQGKWMKGLKIQEN